MVGKKHMKHAGVSAAILSVMLLVASPGSVRAAGVGVESGNRWEYQVFWTHEPDLHTVCYKSDQAICFNKNVGRRITEIADKGWEIMRIERQKYFDGKQRRYYFIYARRPKQ